MSEKIIQELQEAGITVNGKPVEELPDVLYPMGYCFARAHGLSPKEAHQIAMEALE